MLEFDFLGHTPQIDEKKFEVLKERIRAKYDELNNALNNNDHPNNYIAVANRTELQNAEKAFRLNRHSKQNIDCYLDSYKMLRSIHLILAEEFFPGSVYTPFTPEIEYDHFLQNEVPQCSSAIAADLFPQHFFGMNFANNTYRAPTFINEVPSVRSYPYLFEMDLTADLHFYIKHEELDKLRSKENAKKRERGDAAKQEAKRLRNQIWKSATPSEKHPSHSKYFTTETTFEMVQDSPQKVRCITNWHDKYNRIKSAIEDNSFVHPKIFSVTYFDKQLKFPKICENLQNNIWLNHAISPWVLDSSNIIDLQALAKDGDKVYHVRNLSNNRYSLNRLLSYYPESPTLDEVYMMEHIGGINLSLTLLNCCKEFIPSATDRALFILFACQQTSKLPFAFGRSYLIQFIMNISQRNTNTPPELVKDALAEIWRTSFTTKYTELRAYYFRLAFDLAFEGRILNDSKAKLPLLETYFNSRSKALSFKCLNLCRTAPYDKSFSYLFDNTEVIPYNPKSKEDYLYRFIQRNIIYNLADKHIIPDKYMDFSEYYTKKIKYVNEDILSIYGFDPRYYKIKIEALNEKEGDT